MPVRYASRDTLTRAAVDRLVSLGSRVAIARARESGLDDVIPADLRPSARAYVDPRTGRVYSRTAVQTAKTFYTDTGVFRTMAEATPARAAFERLLADAGLGFPAGEWDSRQERDDRVARIEQAFRDRLRREGRPVPRGRKALYAEGSAFRAALDRLSQPAPPGLKRWRNVRAQELKTQALETLGLRPKGFQPPSGTYTAAELAAAWRAAGVSRPPKLALKVRRETRRSRREQRRGRR